jgi:xylose isomerase
LDSVVSDIHSIFDLRNDNGRLRVYEGKREHYIELMNKVNHENRDEIIRFLNMATEVPEDFQEMDDIFK